MVFPSSVCPKTCTLNHFLFQSCSNLQNKKCTQHWIVHLLSYFECRWKNSLFHGTNFFSQWWRDRQNTNFWYIFKRNHYIYHCYHFCCDVVHNNFDYMESNLLSKNKTNHNGAETVESTESKSLMNTTFDPPLKLMSLWLYE